jgi:hypothetical protein
MTAATYILPIRSRGPVDTDLTEYLAGIAADCELIVVDGSDADVFAAAHRDWGRLGQHVRPDAAIAARNGKVRGVLTGIGLASHERIVIADDDVRYGRTEIQEVIRALDDADLVRPQNYFSPLVWHARWDTARTLINRAFGTDFPGTLAVRKSVMQRIGGYDGNVLFENLELIRTFQAAHARVVSPLDLYVRRLPPTGTHFWSQRIRQAYDELARPWRFALFLALLPAAAWGVRRRPRSLLLAVTTSVGIAEYGRRRAGGRRVFPASSVLLAPVWLLERSVCSWLAACARLRGGCRYGDERIRDAATPRRALRRRLASTTFSGRSAVHG